MYIYRVNVSTFTIAIKQRRECLIKLVCYVLLPLKPLSIVYKLNNSFCLSILQRNLVYTITQRDGYTLEIY